MSHSDRPTDVSIRECTALLWISVINLSDTSNLGTDPVLLLAVVGLISDS